MSTLPVDRRVGRGFTLVEMLVVITIIGLLAGLAIPAVIVARTHVRNAAVAMEVKQLEIACQAYKERFGEYPPDLDGDVTNTTVQNTILRHLAKAFPRYIPGVSTQGGPNPQVGWQGFLADVFNGWSVSVTDSGYANNDAYFLLSPSSALIFFLGGKPAWQVDASGNPILPNNAAFNSAQPVTGFLGFSANPLNPFDSTASRIQAFYDFNLSCLQFVTTGSRANNAPGGFVFWPDNAFDTTNGSPIVYFRAENGNYTTDSQTAWADPAGTGSANLKYWFRSAAAGDTVKVFPAADFRLSQGAAATTPYVWINPNSVQIFTSGLDATYTQPTDYTATTYYRPLQFPTGGNYDQSGHTFDDITNFSGGKLESAIP